MKRFIFAVFAVSALLFALPLFADPPADKGKDKKPDKAEKAEETDANSDDTASKSDESGVQGILCHVTDDEAQTGKVVPYPSEEKKEQLLGDGACEHFTIDKDPDDKIVAGRPCTCNGAPSK